jgi:hypothetical protein
MPKRRKKDRKNNNAIYGSTKPDTETFFIVVPPHQQQPRQKQKGKARWFMVGLIFILVRVHHVVNRLSVRACVACVATTNGTAAEENSEELLL